MFWEAKAQKLAGRVGKALELFREALVAFGSARRFDDLRAEASAVVREHISP